MDYLKLERNESGKPFLYYNPEGNGRYKCWMPLDEELFVELQKRIASNGALADVSEIQNRAKKELLNAYYVAIFERGMSVEDILNSMEADRSDMEKIDQILDLLYDRAIEPVEAKQQLLDLFAVINWVAFDFYKLETRPPKYGKYLITRKDGKIHWETWNGSGWAYNHNEVRYWAEIKPPCL